MSAKALEAFMMEKTLSCTEAGSVVTYSEARRVPMWDEGKLHTVVRYETESGGQMRSGLLALPSYWRGKQVCCCTEVRRWIEGWEKVS